MKRNKLERNISIAYIGAFISNLAFFLPVMTLFFQQVVNSVTLVALIFSIQAITAIVFEIPTGAFADLFGRRKTLIIRSSLTVISLTLLALSTNFLMLAIFSFIFALKNALGSGTDQAMLYDTLKQLGREMEYKKIRGRLTTLMYLGAIIGGVAGGYMASSFMRLPFLLTIPITFISLGISLFWTEPNYKKESHKNIIRHAHSSFKILLSNKQLLLLFLFSLFSFGLAESTHYLEQIFYAFVTLPVTYFGIVASAAALMGVSGSLLSHKLSEKFGDRQTLIFSKILDGLMIVLATIFLGYAGIVLIILVSFFRSIGTPILDHLLNKEIESKNRATILSMNNLLNNAGYMLFAPLIGYAADIYSIATSFKISGILLMLTAGFLFFIKKK
ncbi:MAG TPA: MFS transporter [Nanoarchaeota archaeon]|nr:MFS transporter [Nanoarchaeota archaeon]